MEKVYKTFSLGFVIKIFIPFSIAMYIERGKIDSFSRHYTISELRETCDEVFCNCTVFNQTFIYDEVRQSGKCVNDNDLRKDCGK